MGTFPEKYKTSWLEMMRNKLGIIDSDSEDEKLIIELLSWMHLNKADYTNTFCYLMDELYIEDKTFKDNQFISWKKRWKKRREIKNNTFENSIKIMRNSNPLVIPRNHKVEEALKAATDYNDITKLNKLLKLFENPYKKTTELSIYQTSPSQTNKKYQTYCGT